MAHQTRPERLPWRLNCRGLEAPSSLGRAILRLPRKRAHRPDTRGTAFISCSTHQDCRPSSETRPVQGKVLGVTSVNIHWYTVPSGSSP
jgi:hypothetical protein